MPDGRIDPRSTTDRLHALKALLPELIDERPADPSVREFMRRSAESLFQDVRDPEERAQCLRAFAEIGLALGVPALMVSDALDRADGEKTATPEGGRRAAPPGVA